ncbi:MAG: Lrp/AsnC family transcriptional regulator [Candidatus Asgardarchaeia archaeon]
MVRISNFKLLKILKDNSRISYVKLAEIFGVSETAIRKRIRKLEQQGLINKYTIDLDPKKNGFEMALIGIDTAPEKYLKIIEYLKDLDEVVSLYTTAGDHMIMAECWFESTVDLKKFIDQLEQTEGITKVCPAIVLQKIK